VLLSIVKAVAVKVGITVPTVAFSSIDQNIQQIIAFANEAGQELAHRYSWQALTKEATFTTVATESQGVIQTLTGPDFVSILNETMWDRETRRPVFGPKLPPEWQQLKAQLLTGPWSQYRIRGNNVLFIPVPQAGDAIFFEWMSNFWVGTTAGIGIQNAFQADTDVSLLSERVITLDTTWRYKQTKRLAYDEDFDKAEAAIADFIARDGSKPRLNLAGASGDILPGIFIPAGSWLGQ
jgi:hypothetical protein